MQGSAAGGKTRTEACVGAAQTGAAQRGGDGATASLRSGDRAPQEAAEAGGGQTRQQTANNAYLHEFLCLLKIILKYNPNG